MHDLQSIGFLSSQIHQPITRIREAMAALGITPVLSLNGVSYVTAADIARLEAHLRGIHAVAMNMPCDPMGGAFGMPPIF